MLEVFLMKRHLIKGLAVLSMIASQAMAADTIKVGILHSLTGTMAISETGVVKALEMAIDEVNQAGGVLGKQIEAVKYDGASNWDEFAKGATELLTKHKVVTIFGCWTSASRKKVLPIVEKNNGLLWYPVQYEGMEMSPNIIYTGAAPNQQILPAIDWAANEGKLGSKVFLVGSDYVYPRTANKMAKKYIDEKYKGKVSVVGESYRPLGDKDFADIANKIKEKKPDFIINTINGDSNIAFFNELKTKGIANIPVISMSIAEPELQAIGAQIGGVGLLAGHYAAWNYFQSYKSDTNSTFVQKFKTKFGADQVVSDPQEAAYFQVHLFAEAVKKAGSTDVNALKKAVKGLEYNAPSGVVKIHPNNNHTFKRVLVGKIQDDGQFGIVWDSNNMVEPDPIPKFMK